MTYAEQVNARFEEASERARRLNAEIVRVHEAGFSRDSFIYKALEREVHRVSDELIAATEERAAVGTTAEKVEVKYQAILKLSLQVNAVMTCVLDVGLPRDSSTFKVLEGECLRVSKELAAAADRREAVRNKP